MAEEVKLLKTWSSPYGLRIVWALKLKRIQYNSIDEDLPNKSPLFLQYNPVFKKVPVLVHDGKPVVESLVILEYIDEIWKQSPLLPQDPHQRASARLLAKFGDDKIVSSLWATLTKEGREREEASVQVIENLKFLEEEMTAKKIFGGNQIGYLDITFGSLVNLVPILEEIIGCKVMDEERFPLLSAWMQVFSSVPEIKNSLPARDKMVTMFRAHASAAT